MICPECRAAGKLVAESFSMVGSPQLASQLHAQCPAVVRGIYTLCDCHHVVPGERREPEQA